MACLFLPKPLECSSTAFYFNADSVHRGTKDFVVSTLMKEKEEKLLNLDYKKTLSQTGFQPCSRQIFEKDPADYDIYWEEIIYSFCENAVKDLCNTLKSIKSVRYVFIRALKELCPIFNNYFYMYNSLSIFLNFDLAGYDCRRSYLLFQGSYFECTLCAVADRISPGMIKQICDICYEGKNSVEIKFLISAKIGLYNYPSKQEIVYYSHLAEPLCVTSLEMYSPELLFLIRQKWNDCHTSSGRNQVIFKTR